MYEKILSSCITNVCFLLGIVALFFFLTVVTIITGWYWIIVVKWAVCAALFLTLCREQARDIAQIEQGVGDDEEFEVDPSLVGLSFLMLTMIKFFLILIVTFGIRCVQESDPILLIPLMHLTAFCIVCSTQICTSAMARFFYNRM